MWRKDPCPLPSHPRQGGAAAREGESWRAEGGTTATPAADDATHREGCTTGTDTTDGADQSA